MVYNGNENYIFVSYAHADSEKVLPIVDALDKSGFRVWYDSGIEAGTEWPEYIEERLSNANVILVFMTPSAVESRNCRNEINFALELKKEMLVVYLEDTVLLKGMRLQLNSTQSMFRKYHRSEEEFYRELLKAKILQSCRVAPVEEPVAAPVQAPAPAPVQTPTPQPPQAAPAPARKKPLLYIMLAAVLVALIVLICVLVFGGKEAKKPVGDYNENPPATQETEPVKLSDEETMVGSWLCRFDLGDVIGKQLGEENDMADALPDLPVYLDMEFTFANEKLETKAAADEATLKAYIKKMLDDMTASECESIGITREDFEAVIEEQYGKTYQEFLDEEAELLAAETAYDFKMEAESAYYKVDAVNGRVYVAQTKENLEDTKSYMEYKLVDGKLVIHKFIGEDGKEMVLPQNLDAMGITLPWEFTKK